jgi:hypothetical protein
LKIKSTKHLAHIGEEEIDLAYTPCDSMRPEINSSANFNLQFFDGITLRFYGIGTVISSQSHAQKGL